MRPIDVALNQHKDRLLKLPGCTGVAIGMKETAGKRTQDHALIVFVERKTSDLPRDHLVPRWLDGILTDVVERTFQLEEIATNPHARFDQLFSGIAITAEDDPVIFGTLGCIIYTAGRALAPPHPEVPIGYYLLTNQHVVQAAFPNGIVIQPDWPNGHPPPPDYSCGRYVDGFRDAQNDCAIVTIDGNRSWRNEVPNAPLTPGRRPLRGVVNAFVGQAVYKYGASTGYTLGEVRFTNFHDVGIAGAIYIENAMQATWVAGGDSGSVAVQTGTDMVVGLNFRADTMTPVQGYPDRYYGGLAYPIQDQMNNFGPQPMLAL